MKASPRQQRLLLDLQELDTTAARLRRKREQIPQRAELASLQGELAAAKERFMGLQRELDGQQAEIDRLESDTQMVRDRKARDEQLIAASTSPKEAQALQNELDTLARRTGELEERELELMEVAEQTKARFDEAAAALSGVDGRRAALEAAIGEAEAAIAREASAAAEERAGVAAEIQRDLLGLYEETRSRNGIGAARLRGNVSEGSNMALAPAELMTIRETAPDEIVFCPGSGAILVRVDEA
ncbi:hypothetical protein BMH32_12840 [Leucobacter sp. OLJS4]|nr:MULTISPECIES: C4-type zinc ribbon domain-containing protein [unclassified Leucobacter]PIJ48566.1 hypothetical protein BMH30_04995 [Leucobacter sp. OLES1]PII81425.1 hypothetical protein BMH25_12820 [Leucobacter sp. OLCALW19]PII86094.1 hypothetical protein BMH26_13240 [Leucobacter sp. OLTLW20]PII89990.1 hypothetical protein BMH27_11405 [Leucobacter sp. OLAS13]PII97022.1 hypothetical protein BMH29_12090 [Leucobacter sp. OLDS2]